MVGRIAIDAAVVDNSIDLHIHGGFVGSMVKKKQCRTTIWQSFSSVIY